MCQAFGVETVTGLTLMDAEPVMLLVAPTLSIGLALFVPKKAAQSHPCERVERLLVNVRFATVPRAQKAYRLILFVPSPAVNPGLIAVHPAGAVTVPLAA